jgi:hypothetical protein
MSFFTSYTLDLILSWLLDLAFLFALFEIILTIWLLGRTQERRIGGSVTSKETSPTSGAFSVSPGNGRNFIERRKAI